ncbi:putative WAK receptor-like protein kinase family protein [Panicum miliaceum]|uniref:WAK receptor-like protein kinase family protein n=1 Tax=Panicum miliaceum TaxID=4540 RepID=A0A3L6SQY8_PANMI|nr:putative WAK receptor-like protein kinase family protein [Panicum miliaceum]
MSFKLLSVVLASLLRLAAATTTTTSSGSGNSSCAPATCGNLSITYPFSLSGVQPLYCGNPAFQLTCADAGRAYLTRTFRERLYRVLSISYEDNSFVIAVDVDSSYGGDERCHIPDFNVSSGLSLLPVNVAANANLTFVYNCTLPRNASVLLQPACVSPTIGVYVPDGEGNAPPEVPRNCSSVSVPVRRSSFHNNVSDEPAREYRRLIEEGFVLEWPPTAAECGACRRRGGECRFVELAFQCICSDGRPCRNSRGKKNQNLLT